MKGMILAAGFGTRLAPLTNHLPKPLLPVGDRPLIYYNLLLLKRYGITDVTINLHYQGKKIIKELGNGAAIGMRITYSEESKILGTGGGIKKMEDFFGSGAFLVINGDILVDLDLDKLVSFHHKKNGIATLVLRPNTDLTQYGLIEVNASDHVQNILSKLPPKKGRTQKRMFTGIHVIEPKGLNYVPPGTFYSITDAYVEMLKNGEKLFGYSMNGYWNDIGVLERYNEVNQLMKEGAIRLKYMRNLPTA
jgi:NDP-sugar pyrophosphorylase family protein